LNRARRVWEKYYKNSDITTSQEVDTSSSPPKGFSSSSSSSVIFRGFPVQRGSNKKKDEFER